MEIKTMASFLSYYERTRLATKKIIAVIPPDKLDYSYMAGKFTIGDLLRHIAAIERHVFAQIVVGAKPAYKGCGKDIADGYENVIAYFEEMHEQSIHIFQSLHDEELSKSIVSLDGSEIPIGNLLRALIIHEAHHRGALCIYLNLLGINTPPIFGFTENQVIQISK
jgi:uncharacterized damage-inducible protein DinB